MSAPAMNRADQVNGRVEEIVAEAKAMIEGQSRMLPDSRHITALVVALEAAENREREAVAAARILLDGMAEERRELQYELRDEQARTDGFVEKQPHLYVDEVKNEYRIERTLVAYFRRGEWKACVSAWKSIRENRLIAAVNKLPPHPRPMGAAGEKTNGL